MRRILRVWLRGLDKVARVAQWVAMVLLMFQMSMIVLGVAMRYIFNAPLVWMLDICKSCSLFVYFLPMAMALRERRFPKMDMVTRRFSQRGQNWVFAIDLALAVVFCSLAAYAYWLFTWFEVLHPRGLESLPQVPFYPLPLAMFTGEIILVLTFATFLAFTIRNIRLRLPFDESPDLEAAAKELGG